MPMELKDYPRPPADNGRGLHGCASVGWSGGSEGYDYWIGELVAMGCKWFKVLDDAGDSLPFCEKLLAAGIFPIVRILRRDPPPNDSPEPNPGHIGPAEEETIRRLVAVGVRYFETNNEPNLSAEWKHSAIPSDKIETAKLVALNWLFDARLILDAGGLPGLPAVSGGSDLDLLGALVSLGRQEIISEGCWLALHNYCFNRPLNYPDDSVNKSGLPLSPDDYDQGPYTEWVWWNSAEGRPDTLDEINAARTLRKNPTGTILQDHACFREFEYYNLLAMKYLGRPIPIISTEGGYWVGKREDNRYPRVSPESHRDLTVAMFDYVQRQAPDYYFAVTPWLLIESPGRETDAWNSSFWLRALKNGSDSRDGIPPVVVPNVRLGDHLPVIEGVKGMPNVPRRLPGTQPAPPIKPSVSISMPRSVPGSPAANPPTAPTLDQPPPSHSEEVTRYIVATGDTLSGIARRFGTTWQTLAALNSISTPYLIRPGQTLSIPVTNTPAQPPSVPPPKPEAAHPDWVSVPADELPGVAPTPTPAADLESYADEPQEAYDEQTDLAEETSSLATADTGAYPAQETEESLVTESRMPEGRTTPLAFDLVSLRLDWDPRLDALGITLEQAQVSSGQVYWRLVYAQYLGPGESEGKHHIYYVVLDERGEPMPNQRVWQGWPSDKTDANTNEKGEANLPLWSSFAPDRGEIGPYSAWVDGYPCDRVHGLGLPFKNSVCFILKWQRAVY